jgi:1-acyl-sn-glycerol-3-phosphate acyltransferase
MPLYEGPKNIIETYWKKYSDDRKRISESLKDTFLFNKVTISILREIAWSLYQPYKWLFVVPFLLVSTIVIGTLTILTSVIFSPVAGGKFAALWARLNSYFTPMSVNVKGHENISPKQSYVIVANHLSLYDIYVLYGWLGIDFRWVMKKELRKVPVLGLVCQTLEHIYIDPAVKKQ